jgi:hypothetical protein
MTRLSAQRILEALSCGHHAARPPGQSTAAPPALDQRGTRTTRGFVAHATSRRRHAHTVDAAPDASAPPAHGAWPPERRGPALWPHVTDAHQQSVAAVVLTIVADALTALLRALLVQHVCCRRRWPCARACAPVFVAARPRATRQIPLSAASQHIILHALSPRRRPAVTRWPRAREDLR